MVEQKTFKLTAQKRELTGKKVKTLRATGSIPAVVYGRGEKPQVISVDKIEFEKVYNEAGISSLVDLTIDGKSMFKVLTHEPQLDPVKEFPIHVDFYRVKMDEKITTEIPLEFIGESEAVMQLDGSLVTNRDNVEVQCLPSDLVSHITVDISVLKTFEVSITVADLPVPAGIEILTDKDEVIALVEPPRSEEELAELETPTAAEEEKEALEKMEAEAEGEKAEDETTEGEKTEEPVEAEKKPDEKK